MKFRYIDKVGVEIEGGWNTVPPAGNPGYDGSVSVAAAVIGELKSRPLVQWETIEKYVRDNWPHVTHASCGFHIHVSLKSDHLYASLMDERFYNFFLTRMDLFGRTMNITNQQFWSRLRGENRFCNRRWAAERQAEQTQKTEVRYAHWNFCYLQHGTAECRMLPTFRKVDTAVASLKEVLGCVEDWLDAAPENVEVESLVVE